MNWPYLSDRRALAHAQYQQKLATVLIPKFSCWIFYNSLPKIFAAGGSAGAAAGSAAAAAAADAGAVAAAWCWCWCWEAVHVIITCNSA